MLVRWWNDCNRSNSSRFLGEEMCHSHCGRAVLTLSAVMTTERVRVRLRSSGYVEIRTKRECIKIGRSKAGQHLIPVGGAAALKRDYHGAPTWVHLLELQSQWAGGHVCTANSYSGTIAYLTIHLFSYLFFYFNTFQNTSKQQQRLSSRVSRSKNAYQLCRRQPVRVVAPLKIFFFCSIPENSTLSRL